MKIKTIKVLTYTVVILLIVNLAALGTMVYNRWLKPELTCPGAGFEQLKRELSFSPEQEDRFLQIRDDFHSRLGTLSSLLEEERRNLVAALRRDETDAEELKEIVENINTHQLEAQERVVEHLLEVKKILKPEQRDIFFSIVLERFEMDDESGVGKYLRLR